MISKTSNSKTPDNSTDRVYKTLKAMILNRKLTPGSKILQVHLANQLSVSRTPLVKALKMLQSEKLVEIIPNRGAFVKKFSNREILMMYDIREALEGIAARESASLITDDQIKKLRNIFKNFSPPLNRVDKGAYAEADIKFHHYLTEICGNEMLSQINSTFNVLLSTYQTGLTRSPNETLPQHLAIIDAIANHNEKLSEELMRKHLRNAKKGFERKILSKLLLQEESNTKK